MGSRPIVFIIATEEFAYIDRTDHTNYRHVGSSGIRRAAMDDDFLIAIRIHD
ncbi:MAG: hypothetical protein LC793_17185 [Thermomicrobia bacterium]|nr:hypothetical protein [Thermomicrobia bacterium]